MAKQKEKKVWQPAAQPEQTHAGNVSHPAVLLYLIVFLYPSIRTIVMSFFKVEGVTDPVSTWSFNGVGNYVDSFNDTLFKSAMMNLGKLWLIGGVAVMLLALVYAVILTQRPAGQEAFSAA